ncbi:peroxidase P7 [Trifolium repens]|nr:peroxidase P7 [Trifolium repens]
MRVEELQSSLEAHELRMTERTSEREAEQALKASFVKKDQKQNRHGRAQMSEAFYSDEKKYQKRKEKSDKKNVQCYCCKNFGHYANDCLLNKERESEEANMARSSDDEPVLLMAYESDDDEPVKLTFSDSEEVSEDDYEIGIRLYDSESESEASEDESESEDDSEDEEVSEPESSEDESEDEGDSEESDSEGSDSEGSDSEGSDSEGSDSEGSDSEGDSEGSEDEVSQGSEGGRTSDNISEARASEGETSGSPTSEEEEDLEGKSDSESDGGDDSDGASDSDPESSGDSDGGDPESEDVGSGGQASEFDHDFEGGPSEGGASKGSRASSNGHVSKGETSKGRVSRSIQDSEGGASGVGCPVSDTVPELEEDCDSGIDYGASPGVQGSEGASSEVRSSEFVTTEEILEKQIWLQAMTEELETLRLTMMSLVFFVLLIVGRANAQLSTNFYSSSCPKLSSTVQSTVKSAITKEARIGASILRLFFHDCFVNGCDGSILLDDTSNFTGEKNANPNRNSARGFDVIDNIKTAVENVCPGVVSCADILAISAADSVAILGGPTWNVKLGRRDAKTASQSAANTNIPAPTSDLSTLTSMFSAVGLSSKDLVALSGAHTIGQARCTTFRTRIYNETNIDTSFATTRQSNCPSTSGSGDNNLAPLDLQTPTSFDNNYFKNLVNKKGLLHSDQQLFNGGSTNSIVSGYSTNPSSFSSDFAAAMIKMGDISPLTGSNGEIRKNCRATN